MGKGRGSASDWAGLRWSSAAGTCALGRGKVCMKKGVRREFGEGVCGEGKGRESGRGNCSRHFLTGAERIRGEKCFCESKTIKSRIFLATLLY